MRQKRSLLILLVLCLGLVGLVSEVAAQRKPPRDPGGPNNPNPNPPGAAPRDPNGPFDPNANLPQDPNKPRDPNAPGGPFNPDFPLNSLQFQNMIDRFKRGDVPRIDDPTSLRKENIRQMLEEIDKRLNPLIKKTLKDSAQVDVEALKEPSGPQSKDAAAKGLAALENLKKLKGLGSSEPPPGDPQQPTELPIADDGLGDLPVQQLVQIQSLLTEAADQSPRQNSGENKHPWHGTGGALLGWATFPSALPGSDFRGTGGSSPAAGGDHWTFIARTAGGNSGQGWGPWEVSLTPVLNGGGGTANSHPYFNPSGFQIVSAGKEKLYRSAYGFNDRALQVTPFNQPGTNTGPSGHHSWDDVTPKLLMGQSASTSPTPFTGTYRPQFYFRTTDVTQNDIGIQSLKLAHEGFEPAGHSGRSGDNPNARGGVWSNPEIDDQVLVGFVPGQQNTIEPTGIEFPKVQFHLPANNSAQGWATFPMAYNTAETFSKGHASVLGQLQNSQQTQHGTNSVLANGVALIPTYGNAVQFNPETISRTMSVHSSSDSGEPTRPGDVLLHRWQRNGISHVTKIDALTLKQTVLPDGTADRFNGKYLVSGATHKYSNVTVHGWDPKKKEEIVGEAGSTQDKRRQSLYFPETMLQEIHEPASDKQSDGNYILTGIGHAASNVHVHSWDPIKKDVIVGQTDDATQHVPGRLEYPTLIFHLPEAGGNKSKSLRASLGAVQPMTAKYTMFLSNGTPVRGAIDTSKVRMLTLNNDPVSPEIYDFPGGYAQRFDGLDKSVPGGRTETVDNNETITIHGHRTETVDKMETITIHQNRFPAGADTPRLQSLSFLSGQPLQTGVAGIRNEQLNNKYPENMRHEVREHVGDYRNLALTSVPRTLSHAIEVPNLKLTFSAADAASIKYTMLLKQGTPVRGQPGAVGDPYAFTSDPRSSGLSAIRNEQLNNKYPENMKHEVREHVGDFGRVKVQFAWDREGNAAAANSGGTLVTPSFHREWISGGSNQGSAADNSAGLARIKVKFPWLTGTDDSGASAGNGIHFPLHAGTEVAIAHASGNSHMPPYALPSKTMSGIQSNSSAGAGTQNDRRFWKSGSGSMLHQNPGFGAALPGNSQLEVLEFPGGISTAREGGSSQAAETKRPPMTLFVWGSQSPVFGPAQPIDESGRYKVLMPFDVVPSAERGGTNQYNQTDWSFLKLRSARNGYQPAPSSSAGRFHEALITEITLPAMDGSAASPREFHNALISEVTFPGLDASSSNPSSAPTTNNGSSPFQPGSFEVKMEGKNASSSRRLLGHELVHLIQQPGGVGRHSSSADERSSMWLRVSQPHTTGSSMLPQQRSIVGDFRGLPAQGAAGSAAPYNQGDTLTHEVGHWVGLATGVGSISGIGNAEPVSASNSQSSRWIRQTQPHGGAGYGGSVQKSVIGGFKSMPGMDSTINQKTIIGGFKSVSGMDSETEVIELGTGGHPTLPRIGRDAEGGKDAPVELFKTIEGIRVPEPAGHENESNETRNFGLLSNVMKTSIDTATNSKIIPSPGGPVPIPYPNIAQVQASSANGDPNRPIISGAVPNPQARTAGASQTSSVGAFRSVSVGAAQALPAMHTLRPVYQYANQTNIPATYDTSMAVIRKIGDFMPSPDSSDTLGIQPAASGPDHPFVMGRVYNAPSPGIRSGGRTTYGNITLKRGYTADDDIWTWKELPESPFNALMNQFGGGNTNGLSPSFRGGI